MWLPSRHISVLVPLSSLLLLNPFPILREHRNHTLPGFRTLALKLAASSVSLSGDSHRRSEDFVRSNIKPLAKSASLPKIVKVLSPWSVRSTHIGQTAPRSDHCLPIQDPTANTIATGHLLSRQLGLSTHSRRNREAAIHLPTEQRRLIVFKHHQPLLAPQAIWPTDIHHARTCPGSGQRNTISALSSHLPTLLQLSWGIVCSHTWTSHANRLRLVRTLLLPNSTTGKSSTQSVGARLTANNSNSTIESNGFPILKIGNDSCSTVFLGPTMEMQSPSARTTIPTVIHVASH